MQHYNSKKAEYTIQYMHTWILKNECVATYIAPIKQKIHLINTMGEGCALIGTAVTALLIDQ